MKSSSNHKPFVLTGILAALGASLCCITPVLALLAGVSGAASTFSWLDPFRPLFIGITIAVLGFAWFQKLKTSKKNSDCACDETLERTSFFQSGKFLAAVTILALGLLSFPSYSHLLLPSAAKANSPAMEQGPVHQARLSIEGMTCEGCESGVNHVLSNKTGVIKVVSSYDKGHAEVCYDPAKASLETFQKAIEEEMGYKVTHIEVIIPEKTTTYDQR